MEDMLLDDNNDMHPIEIDIHKILDQLGVDWNRLPEELRSIIPA